MRKTIGIASAVVVTALLAAAAAFSAGTDDDDDDDEVSAALVSALNGGALPLERGVSASAREGQPISAKYEMEQGKMQLSVYTMQGERFSEVIVDHTSGGIAKVVPITSGGDLTAAQRQRELMARAGRSLESVTADAVKSNTGFRAISAMPRMRDGYPVIEVTLIRGDERKTVSELLQENE